VSPERRARAHVERFTRNARGELRHCTWGFRNPGFWFFARVLGLTEWLVEREHDRLAVWLVATFMAPGHHEPALRVLRARGLPHDRFIA
jgi:hypothetical protein